MRRTLTQKDFFRPHRRRNVSWEGEPSKCLLPTVIFNKILIRPLFFKPVFLAPLQYDLLNRFPGGRSRHRQSLDGCHHGGSRYEQSCGHRGLEGCRRRAGVVERKRRYSDKAARNRRHGVAAYPGTPRLFECVFRSSFIGYHLFLSNLNGSSKHRYHTRISRVTP